MSSAPAAAVERGDRVWIGSFDGSQTSVRWVAEDKLTYSDAEQPENQELDREDFKKCLKTSAGTSARSPARADGTDVLAAIGVGARIGAEAAAAERTVVLATDGLSTTGCFDLTGGHAGRPALIATLIEECPSRPDWPGTLSGTALIMVGIGQTAAALTSSDVAFLGTLWQRMCEAADAAVCAVSNLPVARSGVPGTGDRPDPEIRFVQGAGPIPVPPMSFSADLLFATGSAEILEPGRKRLMAWAAGITGATRAEVIGYADVRDSVADNQRLSEERAAAVARQLTAAGLPGVRSRGAGETEATCRRPKLADGGWNDACLRRDRRVDIIVTTGEG